MLGDIFFESHFPIRTPTTLELIKARELPRKTIIGLPDSAESISVAIWVLSPSSAIKIVVKVVMNKFGEALYFSRARIPYCSNSEKKDYFRHIGIYAYKVEALNQFVSFPSASYENTENLEQLRLSLIHI